MKTNKNKSHLRLDQRTYYAAAVRATNQTITRATKKGKRAKGVKRAEYGLAAKILKKGKKGKIHRILYFFVYNHPFSVERMLVTRQCLRSKSLSRIAGRRGPNI